MNNFDVTILTPQGDNRVKLIPAVNNVVLETRQSYPGYYKNIEIELSNESLEQLHAWLDCYFKECEEDKKKQKVISNRMDAYEVYSENLANFEIMNPEIPKNAIEYFNSLKNYLDFSILVPELCASHRHTVVMEFFKLSEKTTNKLTLEFLMNGNSVSTILYIIERYNEYSGRYEFADDGLKILTDSVNFAEKRLNALSEKKLRKIFELYKDFDNYTSFVTLKGRLADIFCVLKK